MFKLKRKGFTLIEVIVVMAIMAILVLIALPRISTYVQTAKHTNITSDIRTVEAKIAEHLARNNEYPAGSLEISADSLNSLANTKSIYTIKDILHTIDPSEDYVILPSTYVKRETGSHLDGTFVSLSGGEVYYVDAKTQTIVEAVSTPSISLKEASNPDLMTATITFPINSVKQEYKLDDGIWQTINLKANANPWIFHVNAEENHYQYNIDIPNGTNVYAKATLADNSFYEAQTNLQTPLIELSSLEKVFTLTANIKSVGEEAIKEYRIGSGPWTRYQSEVLVTDNGTLYTRGKDSFGNIVSYNAITINNIQAVTWSGLDKVAFDKNSTTGVTFTNDTIITWTGDLTNKVVYFDVSSSNLTNARLEILNSNNQSLRFYDTTGASMGEKYLPKMTRSIFGLIIPSEAKTIRFFNTSREGYMSVSDIYEADDLISTNSVSNVSATPTKTSVILNWINPTDVDLKTVWIFKNGIKIGASASGTYTDAPLFANTTYDYTLIAVDNTGNLSSETTISPKTLEREIYWNGLTAGVFDKNGATSETITKNATITWTGDLSNKVVYLEIGASNLASAYLYVYNSNNQAILFNDTAGNSMGSIYIPKTKTKIGIVIPDGAKSIHFLNNSSQGGIGIFDIYEEGF